MIHRVGNNYGELLHTQLLDLNRLWYQFEERSGVSLISQLCEGRIKVATITDEKRRLAKRIISIEPPPRDWRKGCQDWVFDVMISLEAEELRSRIRLSRTASKISILIFSSLHRNLDTAYFQ